MLNVSADYALRAVLYLARQERGSYSADVIAQATGIPRNYLGKVLHTLVRNRVLASVRGPRGGFRLARGSDRIPLAAVVEPFQRLPDRRVCLLGNRRCDPGHPCGAHTRWTQVTSPVTDFFRETTIALMLAPLPTANGSTENGNGHTKFTPAITVAAPETEVRPA